MSTLSFDPNTLGVGESAAQEINSVWDTLDEVMTHAMKEGFFPVEKPHFVIPDIHPHELPNATPERYAMLWAQLETWQNYTTSTLAAIDGYLLQCENELGILKTDIKTKIRQEAKNNGEKKPAEKVIEDAVTSNARYREVLHAHQVTKQKKLLVEATDKRLSRSLRILSRYVEIRKETMGGPQAGRRTAF